MQLDKITLADITDTKGASTYLTARFGHPIGDERVRQFVKLDQLRSLMFENGVIVERKSGADTRGKDLFFLLVDLDALPVPNQVGRPRK